jgi:hypothetical protein
MMNTALKFLCIGFATSVATAQTTLFNGTTDTVYKATDNAGITLNNTAGAITLANSTGSDSPAYIFGNFSDTVLAVGESITLGFTISSAPQNFVLSLSGPRTGQTETTDQGYNTFSRSYAGYSATEVFSSTQVLSDAFDNGLKTNTTTFTHDILKGSITDRIDTLFTGGGADRMQTGRSADVSLTMTRASSTEFQMTYGLNVVGGSGLQEITGSLFAPSGNQLLTTEAFTSFAVGFDPQVDGNTLELSNLTVSVIPEPGTLALMGLAFVALMMFRRRQS